MAEMTSTSPKGVEIDIVGQPQIVKPNWTREFIALFVGFLVACVISVTSLVLVVDLRAQLASPSVKMSTSAAVANSGYTSFGLFDGEWAPGTHMPAERSDFAAVTCGGESLGQVRVRVRVNDFAAITCGW